MKNKQSQQGIAFIWIIVAGALLITGIGVITSRKQARKADKSQPEKIGQKETQRVITSAPEEDTKEKDAPSLIAEGPCWENLNSKECEAYIGEKCRKDPRKAECLEVFYYAGGLACESGPESEDCRLYQEYKEQAPPAAGLPREVEDILNQIRTQPPLSQVGQDHPPYPPEAYQQGPDVMANPLSPETQQYCTTSPGDPSCGIVKDIYGDTLQQMYGNVFGQPQPPPQYLNPMADPRLNPMADPKLNPMADPKINPLADPKFNPMADPKFNPMYVPGQYTPWNFPGSQPGVPGQQIPGKPGGYNPGGYGGWRR